MNEIRSKRSFITIAYLCAAVYFVSYITRKNFAAITAEFVVAEGVTKSDTSLISVAMFVCYGIAQLISGWLGDHVPPRYVVFGGLCATGVCNLIVPLCGANITLLAVIWGLNGVAQAMLWPPMVRIIAECLDSEGYRKACVTITCGGSAGTISVYLIAALLIAVSGSWRSVFVFSAVCAVAMAFIWLILSARLTANKVEKSDEPLPEKAEAPSAKPHVNLFAISPLFIIMLTIILQGMLRDGVETWMPSYLHEIYGVDTSGAILTSVGMPIFTIVSIKLTSALFRKFFTNELTCAATIFGFGAVLSLILGLFFDSSIVLSVLLVTLLSGAMHGVNLIQTAMVAGQYKRYGNVSFVSGLLNACTYIGSAAFTWGIAKLADVFNWQTTILCWVAVAALGTLLCAVAARSWRKFLAR